MPILVSDSRGFFTSHVFKTLMDRGRQLLVDGMPVGPLQVFDLVSSILGQMARKMRAALDGPGMECKFGQNETARAPVTDTMIKTGHIGRQHVGGFCDNPVGDERRFWPEPGQFAKGNVDVPLQDAVDRNLYREALATGYSQTSRCLNEGILNTEIQADPGGLFAIGFPVQTRGAIRFNLGEGIDALAAHARGLAVTCGERFARPDAGCGRLRNEVAPVA
jgi:3-hydroxyacyl-CoA dehydrogenase / enoyl-CoA hydratase / 3-hydroxybutyryl-CoA epimerase